jgi:hypothetical protein
MDYKIIKHVSLEGKAATGNTRHYVGDELLPVAAQLQIAQYTDDEGYYLFYLDEGGEIITDTYHSNLEGALEQAEWEYNVKPLDWK